MPQIIHREPLERLLDLRELLGLLPVGRVTIWRWTREGRFPKPRKIGGRNFWREGEIRRVIEGAE